jgi:hypothetical protein
MKMKLSTPKAGYSSLIKFENPIKVNGSDEIRIIRRERA